MPRDRRVVAADHGQALGGHAGDEVEIHRGEREEDDDERETQHTDAREGVHHGDGAQTAEDGVSGAHDSEQRREEEQRQVGPEQRTHEQAAAVERGRQVDDHVAEQEQARDQRADAAPAVTPLEEFRHRGAVVAVVDRHEHEGEDHQPDETRDLPPREQQHLVAVHAHELVGREVRERDRPGDERPREPAAREEHLLARPPVARPGAAHLHPREDPHQHGERDAHQHLQGTDGRQVGRHGRSPLRRGSGAAL